MCEREKRGKRAAIVCVYIYRYISYHTHKISYFAFFTLINSFVDLG